MSQAELRIVAERPEEVQLLIDFLKHKLPKSFASGIKSNDNRPGYRAYLTIYELPTLDIFTKERE